MDTCGVRAIHPRPERRGFSRKMDNVFPANVDPPLCGAGCTDVLGHGFVEVYFNRNTEAGQKTAAFIADVLE